MYSAKADTDAAGRLVDALINPAPSATFAHFGAQTMDSIRQLADIFSVSGTPTPTPTPPLSQWYIGTFPLRYQCYTIYVPETRGEFTAKTVDFFLHNDAMSEISSADAAIYLSRRLSEALTNPAPAAPFARFGAQTMDAIRQLADIFAVAGTPTPTPTPPPRRTHTATPLPTP